MVSSTPSGSDTQHSLNSASEGRRSVPQSLQNVRATQTQDHPLKAEEGVSSDELMKGLLREYGLTGVEVDSSLRFPHVKCHPGTRGDLLERLVTWLKSQARDSHLLWLLGAAGAGKTVVAQTIAELCRDHEFGRQFGAAIFCRSAKEINDSMKERIVPTIVQQLADNCPPFKQFVSRLLARDTGNILKLSIPTQFQRLIVEPFTILKETGELDQQKPLVIILDGLEKCFGEGTITLILELVCEQVKTTTNNPLLWMFSTRPESYLKSAFSRSTTGFDLVKEEVASDGVSNRREVFDFLEAKLLALPEQYSELFEGKGPWPSLNDIRAVAELTGGFFPLADAAFQFIEEPTVGDPERQLRALIEYLETSKIPEQGPKRPLHELDDLFTAVLSEVQESALPIALRILGFLAYYPQHSLSCRDVCNFIQLERSSFHAALDKLHSVVNIPFSPQSGNSGVHLYYSAFASYLRDPERSGAFHVPESKVRSDVAIHSLKWISLSIRLNCPGDDDCCESATLRLTWPPNQEADSPRVMKCLERFSYVVCWKACLQVNAEDAPGIIAELDRLVACRSLQNGGLSRDAYMLDLVKRVYGWRFLSEVTDTSLTGGDSANDQSISRSQLTKDILLGLALLGFVLIESTVFPMPGGRKVD